MTRALVIGYGSIGRRHVRLLAEMGFETGVVTRQRVSDVRAFDDLAVALDASAPDYVVIANETAQHRETIEALAEFSYRGCLLVEKPLSAAPWVPPSGIFSRLAIAYNLRFHPVMVALRARLEKADILAVDVRAGQHLSEWRPGRDYRSTYSASRASGGGVLRDLSHELDYLLWMFGPWRRVAALGGNLHALGIEADEHWSALLELERAPIAHLHLSYLDRPARREIVVTTKSTTITADLVAGTLGTNGALERFEVDRDTSYRAMHRIMLEETNDAPCSAEEGAAVEYLVGALEEAAVSRTWVSA